MTDKSAFDWKASGPSMIGRKMQMESDRARQVGDVPRKSSQNISIRQFTASEKFNMRRVKDFGLK